MGKSVIHTHLASLCCAHSLGCVRFVLVVEWGNLSSADTPVPAAEVLIDLKGSSAQSFARCYHYLFVNGIPVCTVESARRRRAQQGIRTSPRKRLCVQSTTSDNVVTTPKVGVTERCRGFVWFVNCWAAYSRQHYKASKSLDFSSSRPQDSGSDSNGDDEVSRREVL